jgi:hypothetical protein
VGRNSSARLGQHSVAKPLVEVDKAENLREAYPNYFLDVSTFAESVLRITARNTDKAKGVRGFDPSFLRNGEWRKRV